MLKLEINCETTEAAKIYLSAPDFYHLIFSFNESIRAARRHGGDLAGLVKQYEQSFSNAAQCVDRVY